MSRIFGAAFLDSKITSANVETKEKALGYFCGPCLVYMVYYAVAGSYLTQFYTDVLGLSGIFLTLMPLVSKVVDAVTNIVMGRIIDRTRTRQGKARPWILTAGILMSATGIMLYAVPDVSYEMQIAWIIVSYNLFFAFAFTIYNMSHTLMVPLSTRNGKQRDGLAMLTSTGTTMLPGLLTTIILPLMIQAFGVGENARGTWLHMMGLISLVAIPAVLVEYYFTKERITEDHAKTEDANAGSSVPFMDQVKACVTDKYWLLIMGFWVSYNLTNFLSTGTILYFCNWVLGNSVDSGTGYQLMVNAIGQASLGLGIFILWPLVRKFGKRWVSQVGFVIGAVGCLIVLLNPHNLVIVLVGLVIKSFGALPTYLMTAFLAEALDHIEWKNHFRADGFAASITTIVVTVGTGLAQTVILGGIDAFGYIAPTSNMDTITQPAAMQTFFVWCFVGFTMIGYLVCGLCMSFFDVSDRMDQITADIIARRRAEAEARGEVYVSAEEMEAEEQKRMDEIAEKKRIEELKAKCKKKGLNFEEEEAKYQAKKAEKEKKKK